MSKRVFFGVKKNHYPSLIHKFLAAKMVPLKPTTAGTTENTIFVV